MPSILYFFKILKITKKRHEKLYEFKNCKNISLKYSKCFKKSIKKTKFLDFF